MASAPSVVNEAHPEPLRIIDISRVASPLRFVALGRYVLLIISIQALIGCAEALITDVKDPAVVVGSVIGLFAFAFCAWAGWKSIGVLNSILYSKTLWAYLLISGIGGVLLLIGAANVLLARSRLFDNEKQFLDVFISLWIGLFLTFAGAAAVWATSVVRNRKLPGLNINLADFLRRCLDFYKTVHRLPPAHPRRGFLFLAAGGGALLVFTAVPLEFLVKNHLAQSIDYVRGGIFALLIYARQCFQPSFETLMAEDQRAPVLFLRSFADDEKLQYQSADRSLFDFSLESRLADHFQALGPFIAVGEPKDKAPHLGAARVQLSDEAWQGSVLGWIANSRLILIMAGGTHWIGWEMGKVIEMGAAERAIVLFPQTRWRLRKRKTTTPEQRLNVVQSAFTGTAWGTGLRELTEAAKIRSIIFEPGGRVTAVISKPKNRDSYHLAALIAHYLIRTHELPDLDLAVAPAAVVPGSQQLASIGARAMAVAIDTAAFLCLYALGFAAFPSIFGTWWAAALGVVAFLAGCSMLERWTGASLGKSILGLKVEMADASRVKTLASFRRNALRLLDGIAFYLPAFVIALNHPLRQRFGDQVAGTIVVRSKSRVWVRVVLAFAVLVPLVVICFLQAGAITNAVLISMLPFHRVSKDIVVSSSGKLSVGNFDYVDGEKHHAPEFKPGESVGLHYDVAGFERDRMHAADVTAETTLIDPYGLQVREPSTTNFHKTISKTNRITESISIPLPDYAPRGRYFVDIKVRDKVAQTYLEFKPSFNLQTDFVPEAYAPVIRKLQLSTSKDSFSDQPLVVEAPAQVYMRAEIYGLPLHSGREDAMISGMLQNSRNETIWHDPHFIHLDDAYFYYPPTTGVVVTGSLELKPGFSKGIYTETYVVKDASGQNATRSVTFEVR